MNHRFFRSFKIAAYTVVFVICICRFSQVVSQAPFERDESDWIGNSHHFETVISGRFYDQSWSQDPLRFHNGTMTYYAIGAMRFLRGVPISELNKINYDSSKSREDNQAAGKYPTQKVLQSGRWGIAIFSLLGMLLLSILLVESGIPAFFPLSFLLILSNTELMRFLSRAMNEGLLFFLAIVTAYCCYRTLLISKLHLSRVSWWILLAGCSVGLAAQTKLNGALLLIGVFLTLVILRIREPSYLSIKRCFLLCVIAAGVSGVVFLGTNPFLWDNPLEKSWTFFQFRLKVLEAHANLALPDWQNRGYLDRLLNNLSRIGEMTTFSYLPSIRWLSALGMIVFFREFPAYVNRRNQQHALVALMIISIVMSVPALFLEIPWPRYYVFAVFMAEIVAALCTGLLITKISSYLTVAWINLRSKTRT